jgi:hypothetical protein
LAYSPILSGGYAAKHSKAAKKIREAMPPLSRDRIQPTPIKTEAQPQNVIFYLPASQASPRCIAASRKETIRSASNRLIKQENGHAV